ncbi:MAG: hypothetical protein J5526_01850, partial [Bacteroidales bacterium]|nr:hypothetical protein [Bacteroidales bacterium]
MIGFAKVHKIFNLQQQRLFFSQNPPPQALFPSPTPHLQNRPTQIPTPKKYKKPQHPEPTKKNKKTTPKQPYP